MSLTRIFKKITRRFFKHTPLIEILISRKALLHNLLEYKKAYPKMLFAPVLKSNAYGHGLVPVATILKTERIPFFVLDSLHEVHMLRCNDIETKLLVIGYVHSLEMANTKFSNVSFTITSLDQLQQLAKIVRSPVTIHVKVDTGMHRQGIVIEQIEECIRIIQNNHHLHLEGVCSHFADADNSDPTQTERQITEWRKATQYFKDAFTTIHYFHISASAGSFYAHTDLGNVVRLGIGLYGINPSPFPSPLKLLPALTMETIVSSLRKVHTGEKVGYNSTYTIQKESVLATVHVVYFEGVDRRLSNIGSISVRGVQCPIVGRVSMNITSLNVTGVENISLGEKVRVIGNISSDQNSIESMAKFTGTIPWEILVHIPQHLRRKVVD